NTARVQAHIRDSLSPKGRQRVPSSEGARPSNARDDAALCQLADRRSASDSSASIVVGRVGDTCGAAEISLQLRVLGLGFLRDGDVGVGVFPQVEQILIGGVGFGANG